MASKLKAILNMCLIAQSKGHNVDFQCSRHGVNIYLFSEPDENSEVKIVKHLDICYNVSRTDEDFEKAEAFLEGLCA